MVQFFINGLEERVLKDGGRGIPEPVQKEISLEEAVSLSAEIYDKLTALQLTYSSIRQEQEEKEKILVELQKDFIATREIGSSRTAELGAKLDAVKKEYLGPLNDYKVRRREFLSLLEKLSLPLIVETLRSWLDLKRNLTDEVRVEQTSKTKIEGKYGTAWVHKVRSNRRAIAEAIQKIVSAESELRSMLHSKIADIISFIEEKDEIFRHFKFDALEDEAPPMPESDFHHHTGKTSVKKESENAGLRAVLGIPPDSNMKKEKIPLGGAFDDLQPRINNLKLDAKKLVPKIH